MVKSTAQPLLFEAKPEAPDLHSDDALMALAASGRVEAFELLIRRHQQAVQRYCARMCGSGVGQEVAQEVFLTLWATRHEYDARGRFRSYLFTIADRRSRNALRAGVRRRRYEDAREDGCIDTPMDALLAAERRARLEAWLARLSPEQRSAILLHYAGGLEYEEIAELASRPSSTIRARVFAGLARLRRLIKDGGMR